MKISLVRRWRRSDSTHGVTLVELLVTIMILGILSSSVLFAMSVAQEASRKARTQALIATLHSLVLERWETYLTKRHNNQYLNMPLTATNRINAAELRLQTSRQFQKMDFPDQFDDFKKVSFGSINALPEQMVSSLHNRYTLQIGQAKSHVADANQSAECLYLIVSSIRSDGGNWTKTDESFIGDTDNDEALEYLDGWGRPVQFIRWPSGFPSDMQMGQPLNPPTTGLSSRNYETAGVLEAAEIDHDPFDPFHADLDAYRLVPLIVSTGPDGLLDLFIPVPNYSDTTYLQNRWNPYFLFEWKGRYRRAGEPFDVDEDGVESWHDNIHNHLISTR